jgi:predicted AAA+ superfamily ATPase
VGKTTLLKKILQLKDQPHIAIDGDNRDYYEVFEAMSLEKLKEVVGNTDLLFIDEAQNLPNIGVNLKLIHDHLPKIKVLVSGSSSFDLANKIKEPLTGRTLTFYLFPISVEELSLTHTPFELKQKVSQWMTYGLYPEIVETNNNKDKKLLLQELTNAYLYKDVLQLTNIRNSDKIHKLLKLLALQIGSLVSMHELGKQLSMSSETVSAYVDILEKAFVVKRLSGYSNNPKKEISKMDKIYFYDMGVRNAVINDFRDLDSRQDIGAMWENFIIVERLKHLHYHQKHMEQYFWRKYSGVEIDYIEVSNREVKGYEIKWGKKKSRANKSFLTDYPKAHYQLINKDNFLQFIVNQ